MIFNLSLGECIRQFFASIQNRQSNNHEHLLQQLDRTTIFRKATCFTTVFKCGRSGQMIHMLWSVVGQHDVQPRLFRGYRNALVWKGHCCGDHLSVIQCLWYSLTTKDNNINGLHPHLGEAVEKQSGKGNIVQRFYKTKSNEVRWTDTETDLTNKSWCIWSMKLSLSTRCQICAKRWHIPQINGWNRYKCHISIIMFSFLSLTWLFIVFSCTFCLRKQALIRIFFFWFFSEWKKLFGHHCSSCLSFLSFFFLCFC